MGVFSCGAVHPSRLFGCELLTFGANEGAFCLWGSSNTCENVALQKS